MLKIVFFLVSYCKHLKTCAQNFSLEQGLLKRPISKIKSKDFQIALQKKGQFLGMNVRKISKKGQPLLWDNAQQGSGKKLQEP